MLRRQQSLYQTSPTDVTFKGVTNETPGRLQWTFQELTFVASIVMQIITLIISGIALGQGAKVPDTLMTILLLELVVQIVELIWYSSVGGLYLFGQFDISIGARYIDWVITTPVMMTSILLFVLWDADKQCDNVLGEGSRVAALVIIVLMDLLMLLIGFAYETKVGFLVRFYDMLVCNFRPNAGLYLGFIPFLGVFIPLFVVIGTAFTAWGLVSTLVTFVTWALYGVVAILGSDMGNGPVWDEAMRNSGYNLLDIFSKNVVGIVVSSVALGGDYNATAPSNCTTY